MTAFDNQTGEIFEPSRNLPAPTDPAATARNLIFASPECDQVFAALCVFQGAVQPPQKNKTAKVKGRTKGGAEYEYTYAYAPLDEVHRAVQAPLFDAGMAHRQFLAVREGAWVMRTIIAHKSGQWYGCDYPIFFDETRGMQGFASGVTYARRYGLQLALGIVAEDDDDANLADGNSASTQQRAKPNGSRRPAQPEPAVPTDAQAEAKKRHAELAAEIDGSDSIPDIDAILASPAWAAFERIGAAAYPTEFAKVRANLIRRAHDRQALLRQQAGLPSDPLPF